MFRLPITATLNECNDSGTPLCSDVFTDWCDGGNPAVAGEEAGELEFDGAEMRRRDPKTGDVDGGLADRARREWLATNV